MVHEIIEPGRIEPQPRTDVLDAIRTRRSVGKVRPERPPRAMIEQVLEAATWAPNHRLTEPWRFFVLTGEARTALGEAMAEAKACKADAVAATPAALEKVRGKPLRAPVVIAVAVEPAVGPKIVEIEEVAAGAAAVQNMLLAAHALGLAAIWRTGDACYEPAVKAFFGLPPAAHLLGFVYLGYPASAPSDMARRSAGEVTRWLGWNEDERGTAAGTVLTAAADGD